MTEPALFELDAVVVGQPKRSRWRRYVDPALAVSTVEGIPVAQVTYTDDTYSVLTKTSGELILRIERLGPAKFRFTDAADREVGTAGARGLMKTRQLILQTEQGRRLLLTRPGLAYVEWHLTETDPEGDPAPEIGRVTVSTIDAWIGLQQYAVHMSPRMDASERRTVVASVVCLQLRRRPPGAGTAPA
ncbi:hypothetical protein E5082_22045 [Streptomyces griseoluteus]|uniref:Scramblase n=1 Tax=Streptomyces griseoluteus TaxID=29306 RepID=A0A4Z1DE21_STRGP|nr:hypothetical protein [Streptomyces griseoluteus]TGN80094.1 hypothetical protein E5082_22045 [Streptomyces griseoluteus]GHE94407.1 hypothetical protein GCM10017776_08270 [Streptomyces griseoluteus]